MKWKDYAEDIKLFEKLDTTVKPLTEEQKNKNIKTLITYFASDVPAKMYSSKAELEPIEKLKALLAAYPVKKITPEILAMLENILLIENDIENAIDASSIEEKEDRIAIWKGDITKIKADAIVNDANSSLLGNRQPFHKGVDSKIHAAAGPRLREDCNTIIEKQGHIEYAGDAKITRAYCLPSKYVVHTVGPVVLGGNPSKEHEKQLLHCYKSVLNTVKDIEDIKTIVFCGISTGSSGYPKKEAAQLAVDRVRIWLKENPEKDIKVIFNVYDDEEMEKYLKALDR